jgi:predicted DNA-binding protein YlxM (UPF0122 family)
MKELPTASQLATVDQYVFYCHGFDRLQAEGISGLIKFPATSLVFNSLDSEIHNDSNVLDVTRIDIYLLTAGNFELLLLRIESDHQLFPEAKQLLVINVPSLGFLGLTSKKFPDDIHFVFLKNFVELMKSNETLHSFFELFGPNQELDEFFHQTLLTKTQIRLLILVAKGSTNSEIARKMVLSEKGIESAIKRLAVKLDCYRMSRSEQNLRILLVRRYNQMLDAR